MSDEIKSAKEGHVYDGIHEEDNPLPAWWLWSFFITIIFGVIYWLHYTTSGPTLLQEFEYNVKIFEANKSKAAPPPESETEELLSALMAKPEVIASGAGLFSNRCAVCHGANLQGQIGPNLTDKHWINGHGGRADILKLVREGVPAKGMPPWQAAMGRDEIYAVAAFVHSKKGSNPPQAKAPEGQNMEP